MNTKKLDKENYEQFEISDFADNIMKSPVTKIVIIFGVILVFIWISGYVFKIINFSVENYKGLQSTINGK